MLIRSGDEKEIGGGTREETREETREGWGRGEGRDGGEDEGETREKTREGGRKVYELFMMQVLSYHINLYDMLLNTHTYTHVHTHVHTHVLQTRTTDAYTDDACDVLHTLQEAKSGGKWMSIRSTWSTPMSVRSSNASFIVFGPQGG